MVKAHGGGRLTVTTGLTDGRIRITFVDDGEGITREHMPHVFDPFFTTKDVGKGTGLGLSIAHGVVVDHGGRIWAESTRGQGATFIIDLPVVEGGEDGVTHPA
jgi:signal transduction histidine kinase